MVSFPQQDKRARKLTKKRVSVYCAAILRGAVEADLSVCTVGYLAALEAQVGGALCDHPGEQACRALVYRCWAFYYVHAL